MSPRYLHRLIAAVALLAPVTLAAQASTDAAGERTALGVLLLGLVLGLKHAFDADHLVAVSSLVTERLDTGAARRVGLMWGLGHAAMLTLVGLVTLSMRTPVPESLASALELGVGVMIVGLGVRLLLGLRARPGARLSLARHSHGSIRHAHPHVSAGYSSHPLPTARRPFLVGALHGLAGSAALTLLVLTQLDSTALGVLYIVLFGIGSLVGMAAMSTLVALPMSILADRFERFDRGLRVAAGALSVVFGLYLVIEIGVVGGLLVGP